MRVGRACGFNSLLYRTILAEEPGSSEEFKSNNKERQQNGLGMAWFKPTDRRVPIFKLRGRDIPRELGDNEEYFKTHLFSVGNYLRHTYAFILMYPCVDFAIAMANNRQTPKR